MSRFIHGAIILTVVSIGVIAVAQDRAAAPVAPAVEMARIELQHAKADLARLQPLAETGSVSMMELRSADASVQQAALGLAIAERDAPAAVEAARALVAYAETRLDQCRQFLQAGRASKDSLDTASIALSERRIDLELTSIVAICAQRVDRMHQLVHDGRASLADLEQRQFEVDLARQRLRQSVER
jgi:multidrug resistance efflux pump